MRLREEDTTAPPGPSGLDFYWGLPLVKDLRMRHRLSTLTEFSVLLVLLVPNGLEPQDANTVCGTHLRMVGAELSTLWQEQQVEHLII